jgi:hypothetical protein
MAEITHEATPEQVAKWKEKHGDVFEIVVIDKEGKERFAYIKRPNRMTLGMAQKTSGDDPFKFNETVLRNSWLGGDMDIINDDNLFFGASDQLDKVIERAESTIKKL